MGGWRAWRVQLPITPAHKYVGAQAMAIYRRRTTIPVRGSMGMHRFGWGRTLAPAQRSKGPPAVMQVASVHRIRGASAVVSTGALIRCKRIHNF